MTDSGPLYLAETLDLESHTVHNYAGTLMQPTTIASYMGNKNNIEIRYLIRAAVKRAFHEWHHSVPITVDEDWDAIRPKIVSRAMDQLLLVLANHCWTRLPDNPHVTFVDPRLATDTISLINKTRRLSRLFNTEGIPAHKIIFTIPATDAGIRAAKVLLNDQIQINLSLVSGLTHAAACAEANPASITIPITQLLASHERVQSTAFDDLATHPGIQSINSILGYVGRRAPEIKTIGTGFTSLAEVGMLQSFDAMAISARQADALKRNRVPIVLLETPCPVTKFPTGMLMKKCGVTSLFSPEGKAIYRALTLTSVASQQNYMDELEREMDKEVNLQYRDNVYDLDTLEREEREENKYNKRGWIRNSVNFQLKTASVTENSQPSASTSGAHKDEDEIF